MLTELGKMLKIICTKADIKQEELAKNLDLSTGKLSGIITGKTIPEMDTLGKCIDRYELDGKDIKALFSSAFSSTAKNKHLIVLDTRHFDPERITMLIQVITILLLHKDMLELNRDYTLKQTIKKCYDNLDTFVKYQPPPYEENNQQA